MKKIIGLLIISIFLIGCGNKLKTYESIDYNTFVEMNKEKQSYILFIGSSTCSACSLYQETLNDVIKDYQVKVYYIDIHNFTEEEAIGFKKDVSFSGTPTTIFITDGEEQNKYNRINGNLDYNYIVEKFKKNNYIKDDK